MKEHVFNNFTEFADFLTNHREYFKTSALVSFLDTITLMRRTNCGSCRRQKIEIADSTYRNLFSILSEQDKKNIKLILEVDSVKFYYQKNPMFII